MQDKVKFEDLFKGFSDKDCTEQSRTKKLEYLRRLEEELIDLRKEVFTLRRELNDDDLR